jgi:hypothetical protein
MMHRTALAGVMLSLANHLGLFRGHFRAPAFIGRLRSGIDTRHIEEALPPGLGRVAETESNRSNSGVKQG